METSKFIFIIEAEKHYNILVRIIATFNRQRVPITELSSHIKQGEDLLRITLSVENTKEEALKLLKKLDKEIDVTTVNVFKQLSLDD